MVGEDVITYIATCTTIVMDNATFHKTTKTKSLIESFGCHLLYLPTYSPDLNPIFLSAR
ncbi:transposase [Wolbachia endosymbiont (group B) of Camptogramma bilineatum]|uniref:transposase n=1 Tax=Wolbachia endosymbiont (group B) of Camptogramma bilineatum TaxID=2953991 RepID=UPI002A0A2513|nr:transposase [Wolbachia endosymbiont (group B) of Camptogramma bilineatum]